MRNIALIIVLSLLSISCSNEWEVNWLGCQAYNETYLAQVQADLPDSIPVGQSEVLIFYLTFANLSQEDFVYPCLRFELVNIQTNEEEDPSLWLEIPEDWPDIDFTASSLVEYELETRIFGHQTGAYDLVLYTDQEPHSFRILVPPE